MLHSTTAGAPPRAAAATYFSCNCELLIVMTSARRTGYHLGVYLLALLMLLGITRVVDASAHQAPAPSSTQTP